MSIYKHLFFDLDHTLWDFNKNCSETLEELFVHFQFASLGFLPSELIEKYTLVNYRMWDEYNKGLITKQEIRNRRFELTFAELGVDKSFVPSNINEEFLKICPAKGHVFPYTYEVLDYLVKNYNLHIITNGFTETQAIKMSTSKLDNYFSNVILSETLGFAKPDKKIFDHAVNLSGGKSSECIMIGDDLYTDIFGARNAGIDQVFFNPNKQKHEEQVTHEIECLSELKKIF